MNEKKLKIIYGVSTVALMLMSVGAAINYIVNYDHVILEIVNSLGYPEYIIYPLAIAKLTGVLVLLLSLLKILKKKLLIELAYAGFFYNFILALFSHIMKADGEYAPPTVAMILLISSYYCFEKLSKR